MKHDQYVTTVRGAGILFLIILLSGMSGSAGAQEAPAIDSTIEEFADAREMMGTYVVNPLDRLNIVVYAGEREIEDLQEFVKSDGTVYLSFLEKDIKIGGMRILEAEDLLEKMSREYIKEPRVVITVSSSFSQSVSTYGQITSREFAIKTPVRVLQLLARAGGPQDDAMADSIRVISLNGSIKYFDFNEINKNPTDEANFFLKPGDIVFVPSIEDFSVMILGDVPNPGVYAMESQGKLLTALTKAGSWTTTSDIKKVKILRVSGTSTAEVLHADIAKVFDKGDTSQNYIVRDGDIIFVPTNKTMALMSTVSTILGLVSTMLTSYVVLQSLKN